MKNCICFLLCAVLLLSCAGCAVPQDSPANERIIQIACGEDFTLFLFDSGQIRGIGKNTSGQLGVGDTADRYELTDVLLPEPAAEIGVSDDTSYALTADKRLYLWGDNRYRQAENSAAPVVSRPVLRDDLPGEIKLFTLGWHAAYIVTDKDEVYGWGNKLALTNLSDYGYDPIYQAAPLRQERMYVTADGATYKPVQFNTISAGSGIYYGLADNNIFFGRWGGNARAVPLTESVAKLLVGWGFYAVLTTEGNMFLGGENIYGEVGVGDKKSRTEPELLTWVDDPVRDIAAGPHHMLALTRSGRVWAWGENAANQLGLNGAEDVLLPAEIPMPEEIVYIATGFRHSYFLGTSGQLYACGANDYGQLLTGDQLPAAAPVPSDLSAGLPNPTPVLYPVIEDEIIVAETMNAFLTASGRVYTIGDAWTGTLGTGRLDNHDVPTNVPMPAVIRQIEASYLTYHVLTTEGEVYNWGWCHNNTLGHGEDKGYPTPIKLPLPEKMVKIRSGTLGAAALGESGRWYMWGDNRYGALGTGDMGFVPGPVSIITPPEVFVEIAPGWSRFLGLTEAGDVYQWGTTRTRWEEEEDKPDVRPEDLAYHKLNLPEKSIKIWTTGGADYALAESGNLYVWGRWTQYFLGVTEEEQQSRPQILMNDIADMVVSAQGEDMLALTSEGHVFYWGNRVRDENGLLLPTPLPYPEKIIAVFPGEGIFYVAGERHMYRVDSTWLEEGMVSDEFPRELNYKYQSEADAASASMPSV
ncbi:MAG: hypothetical protein LBS10_06805 [Gracilibacteraceae bacterium]|nr:hypothetical protein [Gracilibacteraceae bacterium]